MINHRVFLKTYGCPIEHRTRPLITSQNFFTSGLACSNVVLPPGTVCLLRRAPRCVIITPHSLAGGETVSLVGKIGKKGEDDR